MICLTSSAVYGWLYRPRSKVTPLTPPPAPLFYPNMVSSGSKWRLPVSQTDSLENGPLQTKGDVIGLAHCVIHVKHTIIPYYDCAEACNIFFFKTGTAEHIKDRHKRKVCGDFKKDGHTGADPLMYSMAPCKSNLYYLLISLNLPEWKPEVPNPMQSAAGVASLFPIFLQIYVFLGALSLQSCGCIVLFQSRIPISNWSDPGFHFTRFLLPRNQK